MGGFKGRVEVSGAELSQAGDIAEVLRGKNGGEWPAYLRISDPRFTRKNNLVMMGRNNPDYHRTAGLLAALGYFQYWALSGQVWLMHRSQVASHWDVIKDGSVRITEQGVVHTLSLPKNQAARRLVVVFSGIPRVWFTPSLWRYFTMDYKHIGGLTTGDTAILRIADIGGVSGAFYVDTRESPTNSAAIDSLILRVTKDLNVDLNRVCLLGLSKGATGATIHGLRLGVPFVAVDPVLSEVPNRELANNSYFLGDPVFPEPLSSTVARAGKEAPESDAPGVLLTAPASEYRDYVVGFSEQLRRPVLTVESHDPSIVSHPSVAKAVLGPTVSAVNAILLDAPLPVGFQTLP